MQVSMKNPRSILITGASSGIGEALAMAYAGAGVHLALCGRNGERLARVAEACRGQGAHVDERVLDVTDQAALAEWIDSVDLAQPLDLVIANAGLSMGQRTPEEVEENAARIFAVNVDGVFNTVHPALRHMAGRRRGQIAIVSSLAGFRGMPGAPAYTASKAAVRAYGEGLRGWAARHGVEVSVICPGFVVSRITETNRFPMPFLMPAEHAAEIIRRGLERGRGRIAFPWPMYAAAWLLAALPDALVHRLTARMPSK
jgi:NADP-dependent 3-hydroxy acid dehydrogenase YdfG